MIPLHSGCL